MELLCSLLLLLATALGRACALELDEPTNCAWLADNVQLRWAVNGSHARLRLGARTTEHIGWLALGMTFEATATIALFVLFASSSLCLICVFFLNVQQVFFFC